MDLDPELLREFQRAATEAAGELRAWADQLATDPAARERITSLAHRLRGAAGAYGFPAISEAAAKVEEGPRRGLAKRITRLIGLLDEVTAMAIAPAEPEPAPPQAPVTAEPVAAPPAEPPAATRPAARRVLVVDDDGLTVSLIRDRLERAGHRVDHRADGVAGLEAALAAPYDLILVDVKMPRLDGFGLVARLRSSDLHARTPVLMLTALGGSQDVVRGFDLGADDYVRKPFSPTELLARIDRLLARPSR